MEEALKIIVEIPLIQTDLTQLIEKYLSRITKLRVLLERDDVRHDLDESGFPEGRQAELLAELAADSDEVKTFEHALTLVYRTPAEAPEGWPTNIPYTRHRESDT